MAFEKEYPGATWLSARVFRELEEIGSAAEALVASVARRHGISHIALNVLAVIEGNGGPMPTGAVGTSVHVTSGTVTSVVDTLERNGYIERLTDPGDRRRVLVEVTPAARELLDQILPEVVQLTSAVLAEFDVDELERLLETTGRIRAAMAAAPDDLPPPRPRRTPAALRRRAGGDR